MIAHTCHAQLYVRFSSRVEDVERDAQGHGGVSGACLTVLAKAVKSAVLFSECLTGGLWRPPGVSPRFLTFILSSSSPLLSLRPHSCLMPPCHTCLSNLFFSPCLLFLLSAPPPPCSVLPSPTELREGWYCNICV